MLSERRDTIQDLTRNHPSDVFKDLKFKDLGLEDKDLKSKDRDKDL